MKKAILRMGLLATLLMSVFTFVSCGDDDDDNGSSSNSIIGTWYVVSDGDKTDPYTEITFGADNTFSWRAYRSDRTTLTGAEYGTYKVVSNTIVIRWDDDGEYTTWTFSISGNKLKTSEGNGTVWTRK